MPYINLQITRGASREQKAALVSRFTNALVDVLGKKPEHIHMVIQEIAQEDWGFCGMLTDDYRRQAGEGASDGGRDGSGDGGGAT